MGAEAGLERLSCIMWKVYQARQSLRHAYDVLKATLRCLKMGELVANAPLPPSSEIILAGELILYITDRHNR